MRPVEAAAGSADEDACATASRHSGTACWGSISGSARKGLRRLSGWQAGPPGARLNPSSPGPSLPKPITRQIRKLLTRPDAGVLNR